MKRNLGRISLVATIVSWIAYYIILVIGGVDPAPELSQFLKAAVTFSVAAILLSAILALLALMQGPQRISAAFALLLCVVFGLVFSGLLFAMFRGAT